MDDVLKPLAADTIELCLFRHGETDWNKGQRWQGSNDIPLNSTGRAQAATLQPVLAAFQPEVILSSDLSRAHETARLASLGLDIPIRISSALRECHFGVAEGLTREEILSRFGTDAVTRYLSTTAEDMEFCFEGGETKRAHLERVLTYLTQELHTQPHQRVAVSTHGGVLWRLFSIVRELPAQMPRIANCAHFRLRYLRNEGHWYFVR
ncbi:MAG: histidine phosphatase family protein [Proteobacteria bacterium]|nr:histidine phosphatase family protein [Pseudomonadota bacterium]